MSWSNFHYVCRRIEAGEKPEALRSESFLARARLYGKPSNKHSIAKNILDEISGLARPEQRQSLAGIYGRLDLESKLTEPTKFKRAIAYFSYVLFVYFVCSSLYLKTVFPSIVSAFSTFDLAIPKEVSQFTTNWWIFFLLGVVALLIAILFTLLVRRLYQFRVNDLHSFWYRFLVPSYLSGPHRNILEILRFPIAQYASQAKQKHDIVIDHLAQLSACEADLAIEMESLLVASGKTLGDRVEKLLQGVTVLIAVILLFAVYEFLASAYRPIFMFGEVV